MINGRKVGFYANGTFQGFPIEKTCEILKNIGYDTIEMDRGWIDRCQTEAELLRQLKEIEKAGMSLSEVIVQLDYIVLDNDERKKNIEMTIDYIRRCAAAGISTINVFTGPRQWIPDRITVGEDLSQGQAWNMVFEAYDQIVPAAEKNNVQLAVENVLGMLSHDFYTNQYLINYYNSPCLGVNFDPSHDVLAGNKDTGFLVRQWGAERIKHIHMKDAAGTQRVGEGLFPPLGDGFVDWKGFVSGLDAIGYTGPLSVEYEAWEHLDRHLKGDWILAAKESYEGLNIVLN